MLLNSHSSKNKNIQQKRATKFKTNKRNFKNIIKLQEKPHNIISKFQFYPLNKKKNKKNENKIFKSNKIIEYSSLPNTLNLLKDGKSSENLDENSTFIFTGVIESCDENNQIIDNYLKKSNPQPIFDCKSVSTISIKEDYELSFSKENSFTLNSSETSMHSKKMSTKIKDNNNQILMSILKKINSNTNSIEKEKNSDKKIETKNENNNNENNIFPNAVPKEIKEKKVKKEVKIKKKKSKKIYFVLFIFINIIFYVALIMKLFEPSVESLFYDNDHDNYIYTTSLLSQDRSLVMNK